MINVICISNFNELDAIRESILELGHSFRHKPLIKIEFVDLSKKSLEHIKESNVCIFQSKNAATHASDYPDLYDENKDYYAVGGFTAKYVKASVQVDCKYPKKNYSSKDLIEEYGLKQIKGKKIVVLKGEGGLKIVKESLQEKNTVNEIITYKRTIDKNAISSEDFDHKLLNVIISMSQNALRSLCVNNCEIIKSNDVALIVPNKRFISEKVGIFKQVHILESLEYKEEILNIIRET